MSPPFQTSCQTAKVAHKKVRSLVEDLEAEAVLAVGSAAVGDLAEVVDSETVAVAMVAAMAAVD